MRTSDEIRARLHHGTQELHEALRLVAASSDRIQTALDEIQTCYSRADLIDPAINALNHQIQTLSEEMDRVYSLRNNENDLYLRQENNQLKRDIAAVQQALRREMAEHQAHLTESVKSNEELNQRIQSLERFNDLLKAKINEMKEQYESAIVDVVDLRDSNAGLRDTNAGLKDTVKSLQNTPGKHHKGATPLYTVLMTNSFQRHCKHYGFRRSKRRHFDGTDPFWQDSGRDKSRPHGDY